MSNYFVKEIKNNNLIIFKTNVVFFDMNLIIRYKKRDENYIGISFKIKNEDEYYYLSNINGNILSRKEFFLNGSDDVCLFLDKIPYYNEFLIEVFFYGNDINKYGDINIDILTHKY